MFDGLVKQVESIKEKILDLEAAVRHLSGVYDRDGCNCRYWLDSANVLSWWCAVHKKVEIEKTGERCEE